MSKTARLVFQSESNQLPYQGTIGTYSFSADNVLDGTTGRNSWTLTWDALPETYSPVYIKFRIKSATPDVVSEWSVPQMVFLNVKYDVYKRIVGTEMTQWEKIETIVTPATGPVSAGPYQEVYDGEVVYAVCISHELSQLAPEEGFDSNPFVNPYLLFYTAELST